MILRLITRSGRIMFNDIQIRSGVVGGTLFYTALNISPHDLLFTAIMAVIGAVVSFFVLDYWHF